MALSFEQFKEARSRGLSPEQIARFDSGQAPQPVGQAPTSGIYDALKKGAANIRDSVIGSGERLQETLSAPTAPGLAGQFNKTANVATGLTKGIIAPIAEAAIVTPMRVAGEVVENATGFDINQATVKGVEKLVKKGVDTEIAQKTMEGWAKLKETDPESARALSTLLDIGEIGADFVGGGTAGRAKTGLKAGLKNVPGQVENLGTGLSKLGDKAAPGLKATKELAGDATESAVSRTMGLQPATIREVIKNPDVFTKKEMDLIDRDAIFDKVKTTVDKRLEDLSGTGREYQGIKDLKQSVNISEDTIKEALKKRGIDVTADGTVVSNLGSDIILSDVDANAISDVLKRIAGKKNLSPKEVLNLRKIVDGISKFGEGKTDASKLVAREIRKTIDDIAKKEIPGLKDLDSKFSKEIRLLEGVKDKLFKKNGEIKDSAISTISNLTGKNKKLVLDKFKKLIPGIEEDLNILKAVENIQDAQGNTVGTYTRALMAGSGGFAVSGGNPAIAILGAMATSPKVAVALLRGYAKLKGIKKPKINTIINNMKAGKKLIGEQKRIMDEAVDNAAKKAGNRAKNIRPGLGIKEESAKETATRLRESIQDAIERKASDKTIKQMRDNLKKFLKEN